VNFPAIRQKASNFKKKEQKWFIKKTIKQDSATCREYVNHAILEQKHPPVTWAQFEMFKKIIEVQK
jgi:hypothetical protein